MSPHKDLLERLDSAAEHLARLLDEANRHATQSARFARAANAAAHQARGPLQTLELHAQDAEALDIAFHRSSGTAYRAPGPTGYRPHDDRNEMRDIDPAMDGRFD